MVTDCSPASSVGNGPATSPSTGSGCHSGHRSAAQARDGGGRPGWEPGAKIATRPAGSSSLENLKMHETGRVYILAPSYKKMAQDAK